MQVFFHTDGIELSEKDMEYMKNKLAKLQEKFFTENVKFFVNLEKTRGDLHGDDLYETSLKASDMGKTYFADERKDSYLTAFDGAYKDLFRLIRRDRGKTRELLKRAGRKIKSVLRGLR